MNVLFWIFAIICAIGWAEWVLSRYLFATGRVVMQPDEKNPWSLLRALGWTVPVLLLMVLMSGCVVSYQHLSDPRVANDGYDLLCGGVERKINDLTLRGDLCSNVAPGGGEFIHTTIEYRFGDRE